MPDIAMCQNQTCPLANQCYRFTATPSEMAQAYVTFSPNSDGNCEHFWPTDEITDMNEMGVNDER